LQLFGKKVNSARKAYRNYVKKGLDQGRRPELTGDGLIRSASGWSAVKAMRRARDHMKSDERLLGADKNFPFASIGIFLLWTQGMLPNPLCDRFVHRKCYRFLSRTSIFRFL
jgi:hypothetical protein